MDLYARYHDEVAEALRAIGSRAFGAHVQRDRGSQMEHLGIRFPELRKRVKAGFSFYGLPEDEVLAVWDALWQGSPYGDVLFAALEYYAPIVRKRVPEGLWPVVRSWPGRVDNWCHADLLSGIYSRIVEARPDEAYPQMEEWSRSDDEWFRRISVVSLIHYSGKNAVYLPPDEVLPLVRNCVDDHRYYVEMGVGWVLREMGHAFPAEITSFLEENAERMGTKAYSRAIERRDPVERDRLRALRKALLESE